jgi:hypothetical protein
MRARWRRYESSCQTAIWPRHRDIPRGFKDLEHELAVRECDADLPASSAHPNAPRRALTRGGNGRRRAGHARARLHAHIAALESAHELGRRWLAALRPEAPPSVLHTLRAQLALHARVAAGPAGLSALPDEDEPSSSADGGGAKSAAPPEYEEVLRLLRALGSRWPVTSKARRERIVSSTETGSIAAAAAAASAPPQQSAIVDAGQSSEGSAQPTPSDDLAPMDCAGAPKDGATAAEMGLRGGSFTLGAMPSGTGLRQPLANQEPWAPPLLQACLALERRVS